MQNNGTTRTVEANSGMLVPCTANQQTDLNMLPIIEAVYARFNEGKVARQTLSLVMDAMRDSSAVVVMYCHNGETTSRVLWPISVTLTKDNNLACHSYCTYRSEWKSFRLDRIISCHALTTPDDVAAAA